MDQVTFAKRKIETMQHDLQKALKSMNPKEINCVVAKYHKHFSNSSFANTQWKDGNIKIGSDNSSDSEEDRVKEELLRHRNWLNSCLKNMNKSNK